nr:hypothetical protein [Tanacetum cinerariifolium]
QIPSSSNALSPAKKGKKDKPHVIPYCRFTKIIICHLGRIHNIHQRSASLFHLAEEDFKLGNLEFVPKGKIDEVDILQNINFFRAFTASAFVLAIYIQQFWNTLTYDAKTGAYNFQLDETRFTLDANLLRKALEITPIDQAYQFVSPPLGDAIMDF